MKLCTWLAGALLVASTIGRTTAQAADAYWDINGTSTGATDAADGQADGAVTGTLWSSDPAGLAATVAWVTGDRAIFSAGTNANASTDFNGQVSDLTGNLGTTGGTGVGALSGMLVEEGEIRIAGVLSMINGSIVEIMPGATIQQGGVNMSAPTGSRFTVRLDGTTATLKHTNPGFAGSFVSSLADINLNGGGTIRYTTANQLIIINPTTAITGTGNLVKEGPGVIAIAGTGSYTGDTIINNGEIRIRTSANRLPITTNVTVNSPGVLNVNGVVAAGQEIASLSGNGDVGIAGVASATLTISGSANTTFSGALKDIANAGGGGGLNGVGRLLRKGTGVITFAGQNTLTGFVQIDSGGIVVDPIGSLCGDIADLVVNGGTLDLNNTAETVENWSGTGGTVTLGAGHVLTADPSQGTAGNSTYSGVVAGAGGLRKVNTLAGGVSRTLTLAGANTYSGGTEVSGGRLHSNSATGTGSGAVTVNNNGVMAGNGHVTGAIAVQSGGHLGGGLGDGTGAQLTVDSTVDLQAGGHLDAVLGASGTVPGDYNGNGIVDGPDYARWRDNPAGFGGDPAGYNTWRANFGATGTGLGTSDRVISTLANGVSINAGSILTIQGGNTAPSGTYSVLDYTTGHTGTLASMYINNATGLEIGSVVDNTTAKRFEVTVTGTAQVRDWVAAGDGNWSADPADAGNWSPSGQPNGPGATGNFAGSGSHIVTISDSDKTLGTMTFNNTSGYTIAATAPYGLHTRTYSGNAAINVTNGSHTISTPLIVDGATTATVTNAGDTLTVSGNASLNAALTKSGAGSLSMSGVINGLSSLTASGGTTTLSAANLYTGGTTVGAGATLIAANSGTTSATGTGAITVNGTLTINSGARVTGATTVNAGGIENNNGTATGARTIAGGTVNVSGTLSGAPTGSANGILDLGSTGVVTATTVMSGGAQIRNAPTFSSGNQAAAITLNATGHLAPGGVGALGALTASGAVAFNASSVFDIDIGSAGWDQFIMTATTATTAGLSIAAGATIKVNDIGGMADGTYQIMSLGGATNANPANWSFTGSTAGHTYSVAIAATAVNLTVTTPGVGSAVPEPASLGLVAMAVMAFATGRRSRKR